MLYLLGIAVVVAFIALRYFTVSWKPAGGSTAPRSLPLVTTLYAARSVASLALLAVAFAFLLLFASETPALFEPVLGPLALLPSALGVLFSLLVLVQVAQADRLPEFLGLSTRRSVLFVNGMFSLCRHPMYAGWLLAIWGLLLSAPYLLTVTVCSLLSLSFVLEAIYEERAMTGAFGDYYRRYQAEVPFLMPYGSLKAFRRPESRGKTAKPASVVPPRSGKRRRPTS
jgi:protein-S-isoprenylcysteine O-methyltransferase Ste14